MNYADTEFYAAMVFNNYGFDELTDGICLLSAPDAFRGLDFPPQPYAKGE